MRAGTCVWLYGVVVIIVLLAIVAADGTAKRRSKKNWKDIDLETLEKEWEQGDDEEELVTDDKLLMKEMEARKKAQPAFDPSNPGEFVKKGGLSQQSAGPAMMFIDLVPEPPGGGQWDKGNMDELAVRWRDIIQTGGIKTNVFNIEHKKLLISVQRGWEAADVKDFLIEQPETDYVTWNSQKYFPPGRTEPLTPPSPTPPPPVKDKPKSENGTRKGIKKKRKARGKPQSAASINVEL